MTPKTKMKIRMAVKDYIKTFPEDYKGLLLVIQHQRDNLTNDMAEIKGHMIKRALYSVSEKLSGIIAMKLTTDEQLEMSSKESARWFAKEFPQFRLSKEI